MLKRRGKIGLVVLVIIMALMLLGCHGPSHGDVRTMDSWNDTTIHKDILDYVEYAKDNIPINERIAVFDMDGTLVCEKPVWIEMNVALNRMASQYERDKTLMYKTLYAIAYNYITDPSSENWALVEDNVKPILMQAFLGESQADYVAYAQTFAANTKNEKFDIAIDKTFYKPMAELIDLLRENDFSVYIVSGSEEGLIWALASESLELPRDHLIGTRIKLSADYSNPDVFIRTGDTYDPMNLSDGKSENIYYELGARPIFACGNTVDDFAMLNYTTSHPKYRTMGLLVNHDSDVKEYAYPINERHESINWQDVVDENGWRLISIDKDFKEVFIK